MKRITFLLSLITATQLSIAQAPCVDGLVLGEFPCELVDQMSFMDLAELNIAEAGPGDGTNDIWGWVDPLTGSEYALVGQKNGMSVVDITDAINPVLVGHLATESSNSTWRDIKVHSDYAFIVSEAGDHGMQIFDLTQLSGLVSPAVLTPDTVYTGFGKAHNIVINEESGFAYGVGTDTFSGGLHIVDISDPMSPVLAGSFEADGYTHDAQVVMYTGPDPDWAGSEIAFASNEDNVAIVDVTDKTDCQLISHASYDDPGYTHQSWLTDDQRYMLVVDETDEVGNGFNTRTYIFDVQDLDNPILLGFHESNNTASDHNQYINGAFSYMSNYASGLRIVDVSDIENANLNEVAFFDVLPENNDAGYLGTWSNYCYFPSGVVAVTSRNAGVHFLMPTIFSVSPVNASVECEESIDYEVTINAELNGVFSVDQSGLPEGVAISASTFEAPGSVTVTLSNLVGIESGNIDFEFLLESEFGVYPVQASLDIIGTFPAVTALETPFDESIIEDGAVEYTWAAQANADMYSLEVYSDEALTIMEYSYMPSAPIALMPFAFMDGTYYWRVKSFANCGESDWSDVFEFTVLTVGIHDLNAAQFNLFPNPAADQISIVAGQELENVQIFDAHGRLVYASVISAKGADVDISEFSKGVYLVKVLGQTQRVVKL